jgi:hypothetical protein
MPYGVYPVPKHRRSSAGSSGPSLAARIRTRLGRSHLDRQLAHGADIADSSELRRPTA